MRPIYGRAEKFRESLATPTKLLMTVVVIDRMKVHQMAHMLGSARAEALSYSAVKLFLKNSNLCDYGT